MASYKLRPHHLLCMQFFVGKGYSSDFTANMAVCRAKLINDDPEVSLSCDTDIICKKCPNNISGICKTQAKVLRYYTAVTELCGFSLDKPLKWSFLDRSVKEHILADDRLDEVCSDCRWHKLCREVSSNRQAP